MLMDSHKGYGQAGASMTKRSLKGFNSAASGSPREDIDSNNYTMRQRARMLYMSAPIATAAIKRSRTNTIGMGLKLNPSIDRERLGLSAEQAEAWEKLTRKEFDLWASDKRACDATGMNDFYEIQQLAFVSWLTSGDVFVLRKSIAVGIDNPYTLHLHVIEADRVSTPGTAGGTMLYNTKGRNPENGNDIFDGVEVNKNGSVVAYWIRSTYPYEITDKKTEWTRVEAYGKATGLPNIIHIMSSERPDQYRGITYLAQAIEPILQMRRYTESELTAAVVESFFTAFIKTTADPSAMPFNAAIPVEDRQEIAAERYDPNEYNLGPGMINVMNPGEDIVLADPKRPNSGFQTFFESICIQIGAALEIPADMLMEKFDSSYTASKAAMEEAWKSFSMYRKWFENDFCKPIYKCWLSEAVALGRIQAPGFFTDPLIRSAWLGSKWVGPSQGQLDPVKELTAQIMAVEQGFTTNEDATVRFNGGDWDANIDQLERENQKKADAQPKEQIADAVRSAVRNALGEELRNAEV